MRREHRQPARLELGLPGRPVDPRHADDELLAEPEEPVVGAGRRELAQREARPLRELLVEEAPYEREVDGRLALVQRGHGQAEASAATDATAVGPSPQQPPTSETPEPNQSRTAGSGSTSVPSPSHTDATPSHTRPAFG